MKQSIGKKHMSPVIEVITPAPDMEPIAAVLREVLNRPAAPDMSAVADVLREVLSKPIPTPIVKASFTPPAQKLRKWDVEFRKNNQGVTGAIITELSHES